MAQTAKWDQYLCNISFELGHDSLQCGKPWVTSGTKKEATETKRQRSGNLSEDYDRYKRIDGMEMKNNRKEVVSWDVIESCNSWKKI